MPYESQRTIPVRERTRDRIRSLKRGGESYDEVLHRLMDQAGIDPEVPEWARE
jgi:predicted CopG family antitoxin